MPARNRKDVADDLKIAILAQMQAGMTYRKISTVTEVSIGAIASIKKVRKIAILGRGHAFMSFT